MKSLPFWIGLFAFQFAYSQDNGFKYFVPQNSPAIVVEGQAWPTEVKSFYDRLPARAEGKVRKPVWDLSKNSAGLLLRFISDAPDIVVKFKVTGPLQMPHMAATGVSGVDLYAKNSKGVWDWAAAHFHFGDTIIYNYSGLSPKQREYVLYLPLYNTVEWLGIGVPQKSQFTILPVSKQKPIIVYGTSIAQGACAPRPGLAWSNILSRKLNIPVINLGFSGNGMLEPELINLISEIDARVYVLDCLPNLTAPYVSGAELKKRIINSVTRLRSAHPLTPILLTEHDGYSDGDINPARLKEYTEANIIMDATYDSLIKAGLPRLYLLKKEAINQGIETMVDGTHPNAIGMMRYADAYEKILQTIFKENQNTSFKIPSLIPLPQKLEWQDGIFDLSLYKKISYNNDALKKNAQYLHDGLRKKGIAIPVFVSEKSNNRTVQLILDNNLSFPSKEGYSLQVNKDQITISANTSHGIFNGIQTFMQLLGNGKKVIACNITDWPAFSWRGYMIDVARNFVPVDLLKQQIEVMSRYKLNIFHLHLTEDIAWRLYVPEYPQLTAAKNMTRNLGKYYSEQDIKDLIQFCKERYISFVPEIDMPGHSAAFKRAMGVDMQSDSGLNILKNILKYVCTTYDVHYIHIGADEVKIINRQFVPEITKYVESFGKQVIGWEPGGNYDNSVIRQLWTSDDSSKLPKGFIRYVDSRHLYLNHIDPLEAPVTIFNREILDKQEGDSADLGATLCMWNDRRVENAIDILRMNPVYPGMLAFAERTWHGSGQSRMISNISDGNIKDYQQFESRLLVNKNLYFKNMPFPYVAQSQQIWNLYGPYNNEGDLTKSFPIENSTPGNYGKPDKRVIGGTIELRHWWYPLVKGAEDQAKENSTIYAHTKIWGDKDTTGNFWIGFNDLSRSTATDPPPVGKWNFLDDEVWVNGKLIPPPHWIHGGEKGNSEVPLVDEGYSYRSPTKIPIRKGWNEVLLKCPVGSFAGRDWQNPVKWMFTFVRIEK